MRAAHDTSMSIRMSTPPALECVEVVALGRHVRGAVIAPIQRRRGLEHPARHARRRDHILLPRHLVEYGCTCSPCFAPLR